MKIVKYVKKGTGHLIHGAGVAVSTVGALLLGAGAAVQGAGCVMYDGGGIDTYGNYVSNFFTGMSECILELLDLDEEV